MQSMEQSLRNRVDISVVVPVFNEAQGLFELYARLVASVSEVSRNCEFIFVDDGSVDGSFEVLKKLAAMDDRVFYIRLSRNFGHQLAVSAGLDAVSGKVTVIIDGDLQDPPELIPKMHEKYKEGYEVVYARRRLRKGESFLKRWSAYFFYRLLRRLTAIDIPVDTGDFRLIDGKIVKYLRQMPEQNKFLRGQIAWLGFRQAAVWFDREERKYGKTGYSLSKMFRFALDGITAFSEKPLQWVTHLGFLVSFVAFLILLYALYSYFILHRVIAGWTSLIMATMLIGGVQLISIGIIGEYISRINRNVLKRPLYIVAEQNVEERDEV